MSDLELFSAQLREIYVLLIEESISIKDNYQSDTDDRLVWSGYDGISKYLKSAPYDEIYNKTLESKDYNFILLDYGIIQMQYRFQRGSVIEHRLSYMPRPNHLSYSEFENYENLEYGDEELVKSIEDHNVVTVPLRFDFNIDDNRHVEIDHPKSHLTLGMYQNCRIAVSSVISPKRFIYFVLNSFYKGLAEPRLMEKLECGFRSHSLITDAESTTLHLAYNCSHR